MPPDVNYCHLYTIPMEAAMTSPDHSFNPFADRAIPTLAVVLERVAGVNDLSVQRRRDLRSALMSIARWSGHSLSALPANRRFLLKLLAGLHPCRLEVSRKRFQNATSDLFKALDVAFPGGGRHEYLAPLTGEWQILYDRLPGKYVQCGLSRLMKYCSAQGIRPGNVDDEVSQAFLDALDAEGLTSKPRTAHQTACRLWNRCKDGVEGWPDILLTVPQYRKTYGLPWEVFPESLRIETQGYCDALSGKDLLADNAPPTPVKPETARQRFKQIRWIASALVHQGHDTASITSLEYIVAHFKDVLRFYINRNDGKTSKYVGEIAYVLRTIGVKWLKLPDEQASELVRLYRKLAPPAEGLTEKNRACVNQFEDPRNIDLLLNFPRQHIEEVCSGDKGGIKEARAVQVNLAVLILLYAPMRISNLAALSLERNLRWSTRDNRPVLHIAIPREDVKNNEALDFELPLEISAMVRLYLDQFRPRLLTGPDEWLFPGRKAGHKDTGTLAKQIKTTVKKATGLTVTPHQFRHVTARLYLDEHPGEYEVVRRVLGHRSMQTTINAYAGAESKAAARRYDDVILQLSKKNHEEKQR